MSIKSILHSTGHALAEAGEIVGKQALTVATAPGKAVEKVAQWDSAAVDALDRKLESSKLGNNVVGHVVGGFVEAPVQALLGVVDAFGALADGRLERAAVKTGVALAKDPKGEAMKLGASAIEHLEDDFSARPAHSAGAALAYLTGFGMGPSIPSKLVGKVADKIHGGPIEPAELSKVQRRLAKASQGSAEASRLEARAGKSLNEKIGKSRLPVALRYPMQVPGIGLRVSGKMTELAAGTTPGRIALAAAPKQDKSE